MDAQQGKIGTRSSQEETRCTISSCVFLLLGFSSIFRCYTACTGPWGMLWEVTGAHDFITFLQVHFYKMESGIDGVRRTSSAAEAYLEAFMQEAVSRRQHVVLGICSCAGWYRNGGSYLNHFDKTFLLHGQPPKPAATLPSSMLPKNENKSHCNRKGNLSK